MDNKIDINTIKTTHAKGIIGKLLTSSSKTERYSNGITFITLPHRDFLTRITPRDIPKNDLEFVYRVRKFYNELEIVEDPQRINEVLININNERANELLSLQRYCALNIETVAGLREYDETIDSRYIERNMISHQLEGGFTIDKGEEVIYTPDYMYNPFKNADSLSTLNNPHITDVHDGGCKVEKAYIMQLTNTLYMLVPDTIFINRKGEIQPYQITTHLSTSFGYAGTNGFHITSHKTLNALTLVIPCLGGFGDVISNIGETNKDLINKVLFKQQRSSITINDGGDGMYSTAINMLYSKEEVDRLFPDLEIIPAKYNGVFFEPGKPVINNPTFDNMKRYFHKTDSSDYGYNLENCALHDSLSEEDMLKFINGTTGYRHISWNLVFMNIFAFVENVLDVKIDEFLEESYTNYLKEQEEEETVEVEEQIQEEVQEEETVEVEEQIQEETQEEETVEQT